VTKSESPALALWCDPDRTWREVLKAAADGGEFELWDDEEHELVLRERLLAAKPKSRVVWLPRAENEVTYLKALELQAEYVWTESLVSALGRFGVEIQREHEAELAPILPSHAREWIDQPLSAWRDLTPGAAKSAVVSDDLVLEALARTIEPVASVVGQDRMPVFERRIVEDFGFPRFAGQGDQWRTAVTACLLVTEAAVKVPSEPPADRDRIIPPGPARDRSLSLLGRWQKHVEFMEAFEKLSLEADQRIALGYWAKGLSAMPPPLASKAVEDARFAKEVDELLHLDQFESLASRLKDGSGLYRAHSDSFWGAHARDKVPWLCLAELARSAMFLASEASVQDQWNSAKDAAQWFTTKGWKVDREGEALFREGRELPGGVHTLRARLRRIYLRHLDAVNRRFSELLAHDGVESIQLPFAGELLARIRQTKEPVAVLVLDAFRFDLGERLAERLNEGEPARRASVMAARAPFPSITALGMVFALTDDPHKLAVRISHDGSKRWEVGIEGAKWNLALAEDRREWLRQVLKLKPAAITDVKTLLDSSPPSPKEAGRLMFVFGDEFDTAGHEGELSFTGSEDYLDRYGRAVVRLRDAGYTTVAAVTDHGFVHWEPEKDEVESKPEGDRRWESRRAVAGYGLKHGSAVMTLVSQSDMECALARGVSSFRAYGGLGFFHGGATLEELIIPVLKAEWPRKTERIPVVLTPLREIVSLTPRVEVRPGVVGLPGLGAGPKALAREVTVAVIEPATGRKIMESVERMKIEPDGAPVTVVLRRVPNEACARGTTLVVELRDADNEAKLDRCEVEMKVDLEAWD